MCTKICSAIVVLVIFATVHGENSSALRTIPPKSLPTSRSLTPCTAGRLECEDCSTVKICNYDNQPLYEFRCKDVDPSMPYCNDAGVCSDTPSNSLECLNANDLCPSDKPGFYPDPTNCTRYIYCDDNTLGYEMSCPTANNVYNQTTASCFLKKKSADCFQVDCNNTRNKNKWFVYTPFPRMYFLCSATGPLMFECDGENDVFDVNLKRCGFQCPSARRFPHPSNPNMYYECAYVSTSKIELFEETCPPMLVYDAPTQKCVL